MQQQPTTPGRWQTELNDFFAAVDQENKAFSHNITRQGTFYAEVARPALEAAAEALRQHGRHCETGLDQLRLYLIIHRPDGPVEFQYAVVAEARIEAVTPYIHCWFEENVLDDAPAAKKEGEEDEKKGKSEEEKPQDEEDKEKGKSEDEKKSGEPAGKPDDKKDDKKPKRTKTIEMLGTWDPGREIESVTQEEILADFVAHYQEAVGRLRTHLHVRPAADSGEQPA